MKNIGHEDLSWGEVAICNDYAEIVIDYCRENNIDLSGPFEAECGVLECNNKVLNFNEWCAYDLDHYIDDIIITIGMLVEQ